MTLPFMALFMLGGALSFNIEKEETKIGIVALFLFRKSPLGSAGLVWRVLTFGSFRRCIFTWSWSNPVHLGFGKFPVVAP
jgi:hypothetical protein